MSADGLCFLRFGSVFFGSVSGFSANPRVGFGLLLQPAVRLRVNFFQKRVFGSGSGWRSNPRVGFGP